ncbi:MAG: hypothetical protein LAT67_05765 [Balneolales bacterium]|nr:hypothetical protein [Balneolales bacterium]
MVTLAVIEFGLLAVALVLSWAHVKWIRNKKDTSDPSTQLHDHFNMEWNGMDDDEIYAWYRVRFKILQLEEDDRNRAKKLELIEEYVRKLRTKPMRSKSYVSEYGVLEGSDIDDGNDSGLYEFELK